MGRIGLVQHACPRRPYLSATHDRNRLVFLAARLGHAAAASVGDMNGSRRGHDELLRFQFRGARGILKQPGANRTEDEAAKMSHIGDSATLYVGHGADLTEELNEKPDSYQQCSRNERYAGEYAEEKQGTYSITRVGNQKSAHYACNRTTGTQIRNVGLRRS